MKREKEEIDEEVDEKELKKEKRQEAVAKRKGAKKRDKIARWGGLILLGLIMFVGFLLWVAGETKQDINDGNTRVQKYTNVPMSTTTDSVIVR